MDYTLYIVIFSSVIILSYFFDLYSKKSGIPSVLMLIALGVVSNVILNISGNPIPEEDIYPILVPLGTVGLIFIVLEAALDLKLLRDRLWMIIKSLMVSSIGLALTAYLSAKMFEGLLSDLSFEHALLFTIPLSILSSAIIIPSLGALPEKRKEFMVYESVLSDIVGIVAFYAVLSSSKMIDKSDVLPSTIRDLVITLVLSVLFGYLLIYLFQKLKGHAKIYLLIAVLMLLYSLGKYLHLPSLVIVFVFGLILNNYSLFFKGKLRGFIDFEKIDSVLHDFKTVTAESAFVIRTFFFVVFGLSITLSSLFQDWKIILFGVLTIVIIYAVRAFVLLVFHGSIKINSVLPELFLAPRGLITILLFFSIPNEIKEGFKFGQYFDGVLLFVILCSCIIMMLSLMHEKKKSLLIEVENKENEENDENEEELEN